VDTRCEADGQFVSERNAEFHAFGAGEPRVWHDPLDRLMFAREFVRIGLPEDFVHEIDFGDIGISRTARRRRYAVDWPNRSHSLMK
jgi:hypothetical protein